MMRFVYALVILLYTACSSKQKADFIPMKEMRAIAWDLARADELASIRKNNDSTINLKSVSFELYEQVFAIHKISRERFYRSLRYYQQHPVQLKVILDSVSKLAEKKNESKIVPVKDH